MDRREFFKIVGTASGGIVTGACGRPAREVLPVLVPEEQLVPGEQQWHPGVCRECGAGCGTIVRVMEAERPIEVDGEKVLQRLAAIKKIEGNPLDPVSGGRLCARGQAAVQDLYHPDRLRGPQKRSGERGKGAFAAISWEQALEEAAALFQKVEDPSRVVFLTRPEAGSRAATVASFLRALGAPPAATPGFDDFTIEREAIRIAFGWEGLPVYEIQDADCVLSLGADFLGGWLSPVFYSRRFGHMRQGRPGRRGRLIHAESRFSLTAGAADRWLPVRPGGEHALALAIGHVLAKEKLAAADRAPAGLPASFESVDFDRAVKISGLPAEQVRAVAIELGRSEAPVVLPGASIVQSNSLDAVVTANTLNILLGAAGRKGGVLAPAPPVYASSAPRYRESLAKELEAAELVVLDGVNPVYALPGARDVLTRAPAVLSFSTMIDDSSAYADLILPDHAGLESAAVMEPPVSPGPALTGARPFVRPLHDTRSTEEVLADLAKRLGKTVEVETPEHAFERVFTRSSEWANAGEFTENCLQQGGWWGGAEAGPGVQVRSWRIAPLREPEFDGDPEKFPLHFQPYPSVQFGDGSGARLPWLQELPDPASSAMWGLPVEIDPGTARRLGVKNGDSVRVISPRGELEAPVYVHPAALPGVASMAIGQGHAHYGRYASGRGANPLAIAANAAAFGATRVRIERTGRRGRLVQFSMMDREPDYPRR